MDFIELKVPKLNSPDIVAAADRHKLFPNAFNNAFAAIVRASGGNVNGLVLSASTSSRAIKKVRTEMFDKVKKDFKALVKDEFVSILWDEKLTQKGGDLTAFEHIAVLSSHRSETKLLETTSLEKGIGENQAEAIKSILNDWELDKQCVAMCFDTTASNTGKFNGA